MANRRRLTACFLGVPLAAAAVLFACSEEVRPPVSDGPYANPDGGKIVASDAAGGGGDATTGNDSGATPPLFPGYQPLGICADGDTVYVGLTPDDRTKPGKITRIDPGGAITDLVVNAQVPRVLVVGNNTLIYIDYTRFPTLTFMKLDLTNVSAGAQPYDVGLDAGLINVGDLLIQDDALYYSFKPNSSIEICRTSLGGTGCDPITTLSSVDRPSGLALDDAGVYFVGADVPGGLIASSVPDAGIARTLVTSSQGFFGPITVSDGFIYFTVTNDPDGIIYKMPTSGGTPAPLAKGVTEPTSIVVADSFAYYTSDMTNGYVARVPIDNDGGAPEVVQLATTPSTVVLGATALFVAADHTVIRIPR